MSQFAQLPAADLKRAMDECFEYDDVLRAGGHFSGGEALEDASTAITLRFSGGRLEATDGPFAETKEQLGGILILEADSMEHAVELMSKHPGVRSGPNSKLDDSSVAPFDLGQATNCPIAQRDANN